MSILHIWKQGAHTKSLSTKKQAMVPKESVGYIDLADAQLEAASGGYGQWGQWGQWSQYEEQSYRQHHSKGHHWHDQQHSSSSNPNSPPSALQSFTGHW